MIEELLTEIVNEWFEEIKKTYCIGSPDILIWMDRKKLKTLERLEHLNFCLSRVLSGSDLYGPHIKLLKSELPVKVFDLVLDSWRDKAKYALTVLRNLLDNEQDEAKKNILQNNIELNEIFLRTLVGLSNCDN